jgi:hypothetical protein
MGGATKRIRPSEAREGKSEGVSKLAASESEGIGEITTLYLRIFFTCTCECGCLLHEIRYKSKIVRSVTFSFHHLLDEVGVP